MPSPSYTLMYLHICIWRYHEHFMLLCRLVVVTLTAANWFKAASATAGGGEAGTNVGLSEHGWCIQTWGCHCLSLHSNPNKATYPAAGHFGKGRALPAPCYLVPTSQLMPV